jgi:hypothetical protein
MAGVAAPLWPEIMLTYLPERLEHIPAARFIEHASPPRPCGTGRVYSEGLFPSATPRIDRRRGPVTYGEPAWQRLREEDVIALLGHDPAQED